MSFSMFITSFAPNVQNQQALSEHAKALPSINGATFQFPLLLRGTKTFWELRQGKDWGAVASPKVSSLEEVEKVKRLDVLS